ncbi:MAG: class III extradiol dioxygenase family protein [Xanthobacteraceae bacterium]
MANIIGGIGSTHVPAIGGAIAKGLQQDPYWKPFFDGFTHARDWVAEVKPDVAVVFYNDHGLNFFLDKMPTFAVGAAPEYHHEDEGWGIGFKHPYKGDPDFSWHVINSLVEHEFDVVSCQEMTVDHALTIPLALLWPEDKSPPVKVVPIMINTVQHPLPSPARCLKLGQAVGRAVESYKPDVNVLVLGTGGLSHQLDGKRAGFINKEFDALCMDKLVNDPAALAKYSVMDIVEQAGTQGIEILNWIAMRGALTGRVSQAYRNYHIPISNTASALQVLNNKSIANELPLRKAG